MSLTNAVGGSIFDRAVANQTLEYAPALTATTTSPTLGTGSVASGWYVTAGQAVSGAARFYFGTGGASAGSGAYRISLPLAAVTSGVQFANGSLGAGSIVGTWHARDGSAPDDNLGTLQLVTSTTVLLLRADGGSVSNSAPWTWGNEDRINATFLYLAAP